MRPIRYDTIQEFNVDSKAECDQLNIAHETKTNKRQPVPTSSVQVQIREGSPEGIKRLWREGFVKEMSFKSGEKGRIVIDGESKGGDCDEVICAG